MLAHAEARTKCACKISIDPWGGHVLTCKKHTGSIRGHNHFMDVLANLARSSKISSVHINHCVSTTGGGRHTQGNVEILPYSLAGFDCLVIDCPITCEFASSSRVDGGWRNGHLRTNNILEARARVKNNK